MSARAWLPTLADLDAATAATAAAIADPEASLADVERAAELEETLYSQLEPGPCDRVADPPPRESRIDWTPELDVETADLRAAEAEAELEAALWMADSREQLEAVEAARTQMRQERHALTAAPQAERWLHAVPEPAAELEAGI